MKKQIKDLVGRRFDFDITFTVRKNGYKSWNIEAEITNARLKHLTLNLDPINFQVHCFTNDEELIENLYRSKLNKDDYFWDNEDVRSEIERLIIDELMEEFPRYAVMDETNNVLFALYHFRTDMEELHLSFNAKIYDTWREI